MQQFQRERRLFLGAVLAVGATGVAAQVWPPAVVRIVVPYPPGSEPDVLARDLGAAFARQTGKTFVVDNRPGANSIIGTTEVVNNGDAEGGTLLLVDRLAVVTNPALYRKLPYRWETSLVPVSDLAGVRLFLSVRAGFPAKTYAEFVGYARANPGKVMVGTGGNGHVTHIGMAMLAQSEGLTFTYVPYKGVAPAMQGLLGGEIDAMLAGGLVTQPHHRAQKITALVVGDDQRGPAMPDVPTLAEAGGKPGSLPSTTFTLLAPAKVPAAVVARISTTVGELLATPELRRGYEARGLVVTPSTPEHTLAAMKQDAERFGKIIHAAGIRID